MKCPYCTHFTNIKMEKTDWLDITGENLIEFECIFCGYTDYVYLGDKKEKVEDWWMDDPDDTEHNIVIKEGMAKEESKEEIVKEDK